MKSMLRLRSCASSMIIVSYARSSRSVWISASRMPSVISLTSVSVADLVGEADLPADRLAERGVQLLGDPLGHRAGGDPARLGVADQARARPRPSSRQILGIWVVLPEPVSPATITTWWSRIAARIVVLLLADRQLLGG